MPSPLFLELRLFFRLSKIWADWIHRGFKSLCPSNVQKPPPKQRAATAAAPGRLLLVVQLLVVQLRCEDLMPALLSSQVVKVGLVEDSPSATGETAAPLLP